MKIIDFERKGNVVRFYLGDDDCNDYWGDDWNDIPYEYNAETVYERFVKATRDIAFPFDSMVLEPCSGRCDSSYCKEDMKERLVPCIIVVPPEKLKGWDTENFERWVDCDGIQKFYFGDKMDKGED